MHKTWGQRKKKGDDEEDDEPDGLEDDFDFEAYSEEHHLKSLLDYANYAKEN